MSMCAGSSLNLNPASRNARCSGSSPTTNSTASGWLAFSQRLVVTMVLAMSSTGVAMPRAANFSAYIAGSFVGLFDRKRTGMSRRRSSEIRRRAPGSSLSPR